MCKSCEKSVNELGTDMGKTRRFPTAISLIFNELRISQVCAQLFLSLSYVVMHIKFSLNQSVGELFSTVSTPLTTKTTKLKLNEVVITINSARSTTP